MPKMSHFFLKAMFSLSVLHLKVLPENYLRQEVLFNISDYAGSSSNNSVLSIKKHAGSGHVITKSARESKNLSFEINVYISQLDKVQSIDRERNTVIVDGGCTMETLLDFTLSNGLIPKVLPEFKDITIGGSIVGIPFLYID